MNQLGGLFSFFRNPENKEICETLARVISGLAVVLLVMIIFSPDNKEPFDFLYIPSFWILSIPIFLFGYYVDRQQKHKSLLDYFKRNPDALVTDNTSSSVVCRKLEKRPIKEVRDFRLVINNSMPSLIDKFGWEYLSPVYVDINSYCMKRENPSSAISELRERALEEFRYLYKR